MKHKNPIISGLFGAYLGFWLAVLGAPITTWKFWVAMIPLNILFFL